MAAEHRLDRLEGRRLGQRGLGQGREPLLEDRDASVDPRRPTQQPAEPTKVAQLQADDRPGAAIERQLGALGRELGRLPARAVVFQVALQGQQQLADRRVVGHSLRTDQPAQTRDPLLVVARGRDDRREGRMQRLGFVDSIEPEQRLDPDHPVVHRVALAPARRIADGVEHRERLARPIELDQRVGPVVDHVAARLEDALLGQLGLLAVDEGQGLRRTIVVHQGREVLGADAVEAGPARIDPRERLVGDREPLGDVAGPVRARVTASEVLGDAHALRALLRARSVGELEQIDRLAQVLAAREVAMQHAALQVPVAQEELDPDLALPLRQRDRLGHQRVDTLVLVVAGRRRQLLHQGREPLLLEVAFTQPLGSALDPVPDIHRRGLLPRSGAEGEPRSLGTRAERRKKGQRGNEPHVARGDLTRVHPTEISSIHR